MARLYKLLKGLPGFLLTAVLPALRWRKSRFVRRFWPLWILVFFLAVLLAGFLTYHGPDWIIFANLG